MNACIKRREISVKAIRCSECKAEIEKNISSLKGVRQIMADYQKGLVVVEYNLMEIGLRQIEEQIQEAGYNFRHGFYKLKSSLLHFTEGNERRNFNMKKGRRTIIIISGTLLMLGVGIKPMLAAEDRYQIAMGNIINSYIIIRQ